MNRTFKKSEIYGAIFSIIAGTLLHFVYEWSHAYPFVAIFAPYNESVWEHLKLIFFPVLLYSIFQYFFIGRKYNCFITGKLLGILFGMLTIVVVFCLYYAIVGHSILWIDIPLFFLSVILCFYASYRFAMKNQCPKYLDVISVIVLFGIFMCFYFFTFLPPRSFLFYG